VDPLDGGAVVPLARRALGQLVRRAEKPRDINVTWRNTRPPSRILPARSDTSMIG
jgi:hypothetical protein